MVDQLRRSASELDALLEQTSSALTRLTDCLSIVLAPSVLNLHIKQLSLISLSPYRALVVLVTEDGQVFNRQMDFAEEVSPDELARVQRFLAEVMGGSRCRRSRTAWARAWRRRSATRSCAWRWTRCCRACRKATRRARIASA